MNNKRLGGLAVYYGPFAWLSRAGELEQIRRGMRS